MEGGLEWWRGEGRREIGSIEFQGCGDESIDHFVLVEKVRNAERCWLRTVVYKLKFDGLGFGSWKFAKAVQDRAGIF